MTPIDTITFKGIDVSFVPVGHRYVLPNGRAVPSVTEVLRETGVSVDFLALESRVAREVLAEKRDLGIALHQDAHAYDDGELDDATVDPRVRPYLDAYIAFRENSRLSPRLRERRVYHPTYGYAGTLDGIFVTPDDRTVLVDLKTGDPQSSGCAYQTAAYAAAARVEHPDLPSSLERWGVELAPGRRVPYRIHRYTAWDDFSKFLAFLTTYWHQAARRGRNGHHD